MPEMLHWIDPGLWGQQPSSWWIDWQVNDLVNSFRLLTGWLEWKQKFAYAELLRIFFINASLQQARPEGRSPCLWQDETNHPWASLQPISHSTKPTSWSWPNWDAKSRKQNCRAADPSFDFSEGQSLRWRAKPVHLDIRHSSNYDCENFDTHISRSVYKVK